MNSMETLEQFESSLNGEEVMPDALPENVDEEMTAAAESMEA